MPTNLPSPARLTRNVRLGVKTLWLHKMRSILTMLGVVFGVGSVIAMLAVGEGASKSVLERIEKLGTKNILVNSMKPVAEENESQVDGQGGVLIYGLTYDDHDRIVEQFQSIKKVVPVRRIPSPGRLGARKMDIQAVGTTPYWFDLVERPLLAGRFMNWEDIDEERGICILTEHGARRLLATESSIGQTLLIDNKAFQIVGIVESAEAGGDGIQLPDQKTDVYIPLSTARQRFGAMIRMRGAGQDVRELIDLHQIIVEVDSTEAVGPTADAIEQMLDHFHDKLDYELDVPLALLKQAEETKRMFNIVLGCIAGISLLVGGIGIMNIMLASVTERTREIGIRRAIGAKKSHIIQQFLTETVVLSAVGGVLGVILGVTIPLLITYFTAMPTSTPMYGVVLSLGISAGVGVVFGLYPAIRAANLDPIQALRHE